MLFRSRANAEGHGLLDVWMSHGDRVIDMPPGFKVIASNAASPIAGMADEARGFYGVQFHPEVTHTLQGKAIIERYFSRVPGIRTYIDETLAFVRENGFTRTLFGRKTHFPNIRASNPSFRAGAERAAINAPIQGTSADLIKRAMNRMDSALADAGLSDVSMLLQVHDELVFEVPEGKEEAAAAVVREVMSKAAEPALKLDVPLDVEVGWGANWGAAH